MIIHLHIIGVLLIALSLLHIGFPRFFNWKQELAPLSLLHRQMMHVHTAFIAFTVFLMGLLCLTSAHALTNTLLGRHICFGLGLFWGLRLLVQFFIYSPKLWRGKRFETTVHVVFSLLWLYASSTFLLAATSTVAD